MVLRNEGLIASPPPVSPKKSRNQNPVGREIEISKAAVQVMMRRMICNCIRCFIFIWYIYCIRILANDATG